MRTTVTETCRKAQALVVSAIALGCGIGPEPAFAGRPEITWLWATAQEVSADGSTVVGSAWSGHGNEGWRWTRQTGLEFLGDFTGSVVNSRARGVSGDGSVVVGWGTPADGDRLAFRWEGGTMAPLPGKLPPGTSRPREAWAISDDGRVIGGQLDFTTPFLWTADDGFTRIPPRADGFLAGPVRALSADGSAATGGGGFKDEHITRGYRWTAESGLTDLGLLPAARPFTLPWGISADGSTVVGAAGSGSNPSGDIQPFRWKDGQIIGLGDLSGGGWSEAYAANADGTVVVGVDVYDLRAFIWIEGRGILDLKDYLETDIGLDLAGWTLQTAADITPDGRTIVGSGIDPLGRGGGFIVTIPAPAPAALLALTGVLAFRRGR